MKDNFTRVGFEKTFTVDKLITIFYMELSKSFKYDGESHDFWEMVYIDKGEMICTTDKNQFIIKSGELTFHKPNEFHNHTANNSVAPNVSITSFECRSREMKYFEGRIFKLNAEEKTLLSMLFAEGLATYRLTDERNPLIPKLERREGSPIGSSQMTKNLLEILLIKLRRNKDMITKNMRTSYRMGDMNVPYELKSILDLLEGRVYGKLTVGEIARELGKSESTVKALFSTYRGGGIMKYYNTLKIEEAKKLVREGKYNMAQIADRLGFENPQYFSKVFRQHTNMSPSEYKASIIN